MSYHRKTITAGGDFKCELFTYFSLQRYEKSRRVQRLLGTDKALPVSPSAYLSRCKWPMRMRTAAKDCLWRSFRCITLAQASPELPRPATGKIKDTSAGKTFW